MIKRLLIIFGLFISSIAIVAVVFADQQNATIIQSSDDGYEDFSGGVNVTGQTLQFGSASANLFGLRFEAINVPPGAVISAATIQFVAKGTHSDPYTMTIAAQLVVSAPPISDTDVYTTALYNLSTRPTTVSSVTWSMPAWTLDEAGANELSPDLAAIVQEVVDQAGWSAGNHILFIADTPEGGPRYAYSYDSGNPATLQLQWSPPPATPTPTPIVATAVYSLPTTGDIVIYRREITSGDLIVAAGVWGLIILLLTREIWRVARGQ